MRAVFWQPTRISTTATRITAAAGPRCNCGIHFLRHPDARNGVYIGPYAQYKFIQLDGTDYNTIYATNGQVFTTATKRTASTGAFGLGVIAGYEVRYASRLMLDMYIGGGLLLPNNIDGAKAADIGFVNPYQRGIQFHGGFGIGFMPKARKMPAGL